MRNLFAIVLLVTLVGYTFAQENARNNQPRVINPNNPVVVLGPAIQGPEGSLLVESFEGTFPPAGWAKISPDGGTGWTTIVAGTTPFPGWNGGTALVPVGGGNQTAMATYTTGGATSNDQWLVTKQITNIQANDTLKFWLRKFGTYIDKLEVKISTTGQTTPASFTATLATLNFTAADSGAMFYKYPIGSVVPAGSNIYIGFREVVADNINDGALFQLDMVELVPGIIPVELAAFAAKANGNTVTLNWATATETNNRGFEIQKKTGNGEFATIGFVAGNGTTTIGKTYSYTDKNVNVGTHSYRLRQVDLDGTSSYSGIAEVNVVRPNVYAMNQNFPNPFNPSTAVNFSLAVDGKVSLKVFNVLGQEVATLVNGAMSAGNHTVTFDASNLQSGVYFARIEAAGIDGSSFSSVKKMILNK